MLKGKQIKALSHTADSLSIIPHTQEMGVMRHLIILIRGYVT